MDDQRLALESAVGILTRARQISVHVGDVTAPEEYVGFAVLNDTHVIISCEDGRKIFLLRTMVTRLEEKPLGSA